MKKFLFIALLLLCASTARAQVAGSVQRVNTTPTNGAPGRVVMQTVAGDDPNTDADNDPLWVWHGKNQGAHALMGYHWQPAPAALTDASTIDLNFRGIASSRSWSLTIGGNRAFTISNEVAGSSGEIFITMGGAGSYVPTLPAGSRVAGAGTAGSLAGLLPTAVGSTYVLAFKCTAVNVCYFNVVEYK